MARALLVRPPLGDYYRRSLVRPAIAPSPPLNLALLAAAAEYGGHQATIIDLEVQSLQDLDAALHQTPPDVVGVTLRSPQLGIANALAKRIARAMPEARLVAGGPHASVRPDQLLAPGPFHLAVRGEGEAALVALLDGTPPALIPGLTWSTGSSPQPVPLAALDNLPQPAWHLLQLRHYQRPSLVAPYPPVADVESSRGCPGRCPFCTKAVFGPAFRPHSAERTVDNMEHALAHGFRAVNFVDDAMTTDRERALAICAQILHRGLLVPWTCTNGLRVSAVDKTFFQLARRAGCHLVAFGLESGSQRVLDGLQKGTTLEQGRLAVRAARDAGLTTLGYFMLGLPGDDERSLADTIHYSTSLGLDFAKYSITMPLPGTPLYQEWRGHMRDPDHWSFSIHAPAGTWFNHPTLGWPQIVRAQRRAYAFFYGRPGGWARRLALLAHLRT